MSPAPGRDSVRNVNSEAGQNFLRSKHEGVDGAVALRSVWSGLGEAVSRRRDEVTLDKQSNKRTSREALVGSAASGANKRAGVRSREEERGHGHIDEHQATLLLLLLGLSKRTRKRCATSSGSFTAYS